MVILERRPRSLWSLLSLGAALSACAVVDSDGPRDAGRTDVSRDSAGDSTTMDAASVDAIGPMLDVVAPPTDSAADTGVSTFMTDRGDCDGNAANGCEVDLARDPANCGSCGDRPTESCNLADDNCNTVCDDVGGCRTAVHRSLHPTTGEHFYTADPRCEGTIIEGPMGYIATSPVCGAVALYRTAHRSNGYVWTAPMGM